MHKNQGFQDSRGLCDRPPRPLVIDPAPRDMITSSSSRHIRRKHPKIQGYTDLSKDDVGNDVMRTVHYDWSRPERVSKITKQALCLALPSSLARPMAVAWDVRTRPGDT